MHRPSRALSTLVLAFALAACQGQPGGVRPALPSAGPNVKGGSLIGLDGANLIGLDGANLIGLDGGNLIGLDGAGLIGLDGAGISGQVKVPAGLIGLDGANAVSEMGGLYRLAATGEKPLAGVHVYLRTATGKFVVGKDGKPLSARTDAQGRYSFKGLKPQKGIAVFVPKAKGKGEILGLSGLRPKDLAPGAAVDVDLASTLTASWIFDRVLASQKDQAESLDKLPAALEAEARKQAARVLGTKLPDGAKELSPRALAGALDTLKAGDAKLAETLENVKVVMTLFGSDSTVTGRDARAISLQQPIDVAVGKDGAFYVLENFGGVVRRIKDGRETILVGLGSPLQDKFGALIPTDMAVGPDGWIYVSSQTARAVFRFSPDGKEGEKVMGGGQQEPRSGVRALDVSITAPGAMAFDRDGNLVIGEGEHSHFFGPTREGKILRLRKDGTLEELSTPWAAAGALPLGRKREVLGLAYGPGGALYCLERREGTLSVMGEDAAWRTIATGLPVTLNSDIAVQADGQVLVTLGPTRPPLEVVPGSIERIAADGTRTRLAGVEGAGVDPEVVAASAAHLSNVAGIALMADGGVLFADFDNGLVRAIGTDGQVRTLVGRIGGQASVTLEAPLNVPGGIALDAQGRVLVSEFAGNTIRRLEGDQLRTIAGGQAGFTPDGEKAASLLKPIGIAVRGEDIYVVDAGNARLRKIGPDGTITTVAGGGQLEYPSNMPADLKAEPLRLKMLDLMAVAVSPEGKIYFNDRHRIWRLEDDGTMSLVAGRTSLNETDALESTTRDGKPALEVPLGRVTGMAFDAEGGLYMAEVLTCQVVKVARDGTFSTVAGVGLAGTVKAVLEEVAAKEGEMPAREAALMLPTGIAFDAQGNLYVSEAGTRAAQVMAGQGPSVLEQFPVLDGRIRVIGKDGRIKTVAGLGAPAGTGVVRNPLGIVVTPQGRVIFVDNGTNQVKAL